MKPIALRSKDNPTLKPKLEARKKLVSKSYKLHLELDPQKFLGDKAVWKAKYVNISGKIVAEVTASPSGEEGTIEQETSNEAVERALKVNVFDKRELPGPWKVLSPLDLDVKVISIKGPKLQLNKLSPHFDLVTFGISSEVECHFGELGVGKVEAGWLDVGYDAGKDKYEAKLINVEVAGGFHHKFEKIDLGQLGKWDVDCEFTPVITFSPNWKGVLHKLAESIEENVERFATEMLTVEALGVAVDFIMVTGVLAAVVIAFIQAGSTTGYEAANLDKRVPDVQDAMVDGFVQALTSRSGRDAPEKGTPQAVGFAAGWRFHSDYRAAVRATRMPKFNESVQNAEAEVDEKVDAYIADNIWQIKPMAWDLVQRPAGEFVWRAFAEKHRPTFLHKVTGSDANITILTGAWASCFGGESPRGAKAKEMFKEYLDPREARTIDANIPD